MVALGNTALGQAMNDAHVQVYGWITPGGNISTNNVRPGGNAPAAYDYTPNTVQLDQAVVYIERLADTVQNDHFDWGFRFPTLYGVDYRYTTAYGLFSDQLLNQNSVNGIDFPMVYVDLYFPVMLGLDIRLGRFISIPDIEAQLAPNNYTYVHSLTYTFDNYTNTGVQATLAVTKNWIVQLGMTVGSDTMPWNGGARISQSVRSTGSNAADRSRTRSALSGHEDAQRSRRDAVRSRSDCAGPAMTARTTSTSLPMPWNDGAWGYNNLQWVGLTYYHKFNDYWHIAFESWNIHERDVPNLNNPAAVALIANGGTPFSPQFMPFNAPNAAQCKNPAVLTCTADEQTFLIYINYSPNKLNNFSLRTEYFDDPQGQRTGVATRYADIAVQLAALVLAANRDPSRSRLLSVPRRPGIQWQRQRGNRSRTGAPPSLAPPTLSFTSELMGFGSPCDASCESAWCVAPEAS